MTRHAQFICMVLSIAFTVLAVRAQDGGHSAPVIAPRPSLLDPAENRYCVKAGEDIYSRIERLETALRLAKSELAVNRKRSKP